MQADGDWIADAARQFPDRQRARRLDEAEVLHDSFWIGRERGG